MSREVPEGWEVVALSDVADLLLGQSPSSSETNDQEIGLPFFQGNAEFGERYPSPRRWAVTGPRLAEAGDILISVRAPVGELNIAPGRCVIGRGLGAIRARKVDSSFLWHALYFSAPQLHSVSQGSTFDAVNRADLSKLALPSPPLHEQRRIAEILSSVDEAIAATQAVIEQTRKVKQGVLERLLTKGIGYTRFKQTEIGEIPEGWDVGRISNIGEVMVGRQRSPSFTEGLDFPYLRVANVFDNLIDTSDVLKMKFTDVEVERYLLRAGDILLNEGQSLHLVGRNARYEGNPSACCFQNTLIRFRARELTDLDYAFALMQFLFFKGRFSEIATQTTSVAHLGSNRFGGLLVPVPPLEEQRKIGGIHNSLLETEARQRSQLDQLLSKKSALMSDLLTGRKRVTDALPMAAE